jgi:hypothetical protein
MRWTNSWGRGLNQSAGRAPVHCVLRWGQDVPSFPHAPFLAPALFLRYASLCFEGIRVYPGMPFGFAGILSDVGGCPLIRRGLSYQRFPGYRLKAKSRKPVSG